MSLLLKWEAETYGDIHMLGVEENMNEGKSYEYFASLASMYPEEDAEQRPWDYAMKLDDDAFLHIPRLFEKLRPMIPRRSTWFVHLSYDVFNSDRVRDISKVIICLDQDISYPGTW
jgi:hypothetical protein